MKHIIRTGLFGAVLLMAGSAYADSISPSSYTDTLAIGESVTIRKTVTVSSEPPTDSKVDVFFLSDTTGSMGGVISSVKSGAAQIMTNTSGLGDVQYGVGEYRDIFDAFTYRTNQALTANTASVQAGINAWSASGGGDTPEANLFALEQVATTVGWRAGSTRILVWFGDAPGHDPRAASTEASATAALQAENIVVQALNSGNLDGTGQATRITAATGGALGTISNPSDVSAVVTSITDAITSVINTYSSVSLSPNGNLPGVGVSISPLSIVGAFDRSVERTFDFDVTFTGLAPGVHDFTIDALVDGGVVATEKDSISVAPIPVPAGLPLFLTALGLSGWLARRRRNAA